MAVPVAPNNTYVSHPIASGGAHQIVKASIQGGGGASPNTPVPLASALKGGTTGVAYSETIISQGGTSPYSYSVISGALPTSTSLNSSTGVISGTPTVAGTYSFTIKVTDTNGSTGTQAFSITIAAPSAGGGGAWTFLS